MPPDAIVPLRFTEIGRNGIEQQGDDALAVVVTARHLTENT